MTSTAAFQDALQNCSFVRLRTIYTDIMEKMVTAMGSSRTQHSIVTDEAADADPDGARRAMEEQLLRVCPVEAYSSTYRKKLTKQIRSMGGVKITLVESKAKRGNPASFVYTCGFTAVGGRELLVQGVHRSSLKIHADLMNYMFKRHKAGHPLGDGHTLTGAGSGLVCLAKDPETKAEGSLLKATVTLEPTRLYGLAGYGLLLLVPVGFRTGAAAAHQTATREEALLLSLGIDVAGGGFQSLMPPLGGGGDDNAPPTTTDVQTLRVCGGCGRTGMELQKPLGKCAICKGAFYCSKLCQRRDWKNHKKICRRTPEEAFQIALNLDPV